VKQKWQEYKKKDGAVKEMGNLGWTRNALFALVSDRAGECEDIPPAEWDTPLAVSKVSQVNSCQNQTEEPYGRFPGGITGGEESVADDIASWLQSGMIFLFGDELLWCNNTLTDYSIAVESVCWPNEYPIIGDKDKYNNLRLNMKVPLRCEKYPNGPHSTCQTGPCPQLPEPMEFTNATIVMDVPVCTGYYGASFPSSVRIVDPPPP